MYAQSYSYDCATVPGVDEPLPPNRQPGCTDPDQIRYVPLVFHFLQPESIVRDDEVRHPGENLHECNNTSVPVSYVGFGNFTKYNNGVLGGTYASSLDFNYTGYDRAEDLVNKVNEMIETNNNHWRKTPGEFYPPEPPEVKTIFIIRGVYFHKDDEAFYAAVHPGVSSEYSPIYDQYAVDKEEAINIFLSPAFNNTPLQGFATLGGSEKFVFLNGYLAYITDCFGVNPQAKVLYHELGHTLRLRHTWSTNDDCNDTPEGVEYYHPSGGNCVVRKANCWTNGTRYYGSSPCSTCPNDIIPSPNSSDGPPCEPCHQWGNYSNNVMDYNSWVGDAAITQCQIDLMSDHLIGSGNLYVYSCDGCMPAQAFFDLPDTYNKNIGPYGINNSFVMIGDGSFNEDQWILELCEIDPSDPTDCISQTNSGWQSGAIGHINLTDFFSFNAGSEYEITLRVDNSECPRDHVFSQTFDVIDEPIEQHTVVMRMENPFGQGFAIHYDVKVDGVVAFQLVNTQTYEIYTVMSSAYRDSGQYRLNYNSSAVPSGTYALQCLHNGELSAQIAFRQ